jgi:hypothetical protein
MLELIWNVTEEATEWFGDSDPSPGAPCLIERTATARLGQYDLTVFEHDETAPEAVNARAVGKAFANAISSTRRGRTAHVGPRPRLHGHVRHVWAGRSG